MATIYYVDTGTGVFLGGWSDGNPSAPTTETVVPSPPPVNDTQIWEFPGWSALVPPDTDAENLAILATDLNLSGTNSGDQLTYESILVSGSTLLTALNPDDTLHMEAGSGISLGAVTSPDPTITITANEAEIDHDLLQNFVSNEHIDWTSATQNLSTSGTLSGSNLSGTNTGDQNLFATVTGDSGTTTANILTDTLNIVGGTNTTTSVSGDTLTIDVTGGVAGENNTASNVGGFDEWFKQKTGIDLEFRTVQSSDGSLTITQNADDIDITSTLGQGITELYQSPLQAVVPGGVIVLAHGLSQEPYITLMVLENVTPEHGYSAGQRTPANAAVGSSSNHQGASIVPDATNLNIKLGVGSGGGTPVFSVINRTTGQTNSITNANWNVIFLALA
jgi:hypothetical protein